MSREHKEWDDTDLYIKAVTQGWPITEAQMQLCVDKLHLALATTMDAKTIAKLVLAFKQLYGQNQTERLAARHLPNFAEGGSLEVRPLADELKSMVASMPRLPQESIVEPEGIARPHAPPLFATPLPPAERFGHGVFDSAG